MYDRTHIKNANLKHTILAQGLMVTVVCVARAQPVPSSRERTGPCEANFDWSGGEVGQGQIDVGTVRLFLFCLKERLFAIVALNS